MCAGRSRVASAVRAVVLPDKLLPGYGTPGDDYTVVGQVERDPARAPVPTLPCLDSHHDRRWRCRGLMQRSPRSVEQTASPKRRHRFTHFDAHCRDTHLGGDMSDRTGLRRQPNGGGFSQTTGHYGESSGVSFFWLRMRSW